MATVAEALTLAVQRHQAGELAQAEQLYRLILQAEPANADALHLLGLLAHQLGRHDLAVQYIQQALTVNPHNAFFHSNLGVVHEALGRPEVAAACYREALRLHPTAPESHSNLGALLRDQGRLDEAEACFREALRLNPGFFAASSRLGFLLQAQGRPGEAEACFREALRLQPDSPEAHKHLGILLHQQGRPGEAEACFRETVRLNREDVQALTNLGIVLRVQQRLDEAEACFREALRLQPDLPEAHRQRGLVLQAQKRLEEAAACYRETVRLKPDFVEGHYDLGVALKDLGQLQEAEACFREALRLRPAYPEAHNYLGLVLEAQGQMGPTEACFREAIRLRPDYPRAFSNLGAILQMQGRLSEAEASYREALRLQPDFFQAHSNLLLCLNYNPQGGPAALLAEHCAWAAQQAPPLLSPPVHGNDPSPDRRLRVGYASFDFREHPVASFIEPVLAHHDPGQVEVFCYSEFPVLDPTGARLRSLAHGWRPTFGLPDEEVAEQVRADGIDVLVDLAGHTAGHRLQVFARKPAPVQVTYLGYPNTTGLKAMDYRLTDALADPPGMTEGYHVEELWRLPGCFLCFRPRPDSPAVSSLPALASGHITFGSFNVLAKVTPMTIALWAAVLDAVPGSHLLLKARALGDAGLRQAVQQRFLERGVNPERLELRGWERLPAGHLATYGKVDVALDTFPYHGTTTTCEALWMGVPVVSLAGDWHASRVGASLLATVGLPELVAQTAEGYVGIARRLAEDRAGLAALRSELREKMRVSPLCDATAFTRRLEEAYRTMWRRWCASRRPD